MTCRVTAPSQSTIVPFLPLCGLGEKNKPPPFVGKNPNLCRLRRVTTSLVLRRRVSTPSCSPPPVLPHFIPSPSSSSTLASPVFIFRSHFLAVPPASPSRRLTAQVRSSKGRISGARWPTNLAGAGLRSATRSHKATRPLTRPGQTSKSSAEDSSPRTVRLQFAGSAAQASLDVRSPATWGSGPKGLFVSDYGAREKRSPLSGMDSDLEAFSHNPAGGSFAALPGRTAAKTNYLNPRFLSY